MKNSGILSGALSSLHAFAVPRVMAGNRILLTALAIPNQPVAHAYGRKASSTAHKAFRASAQNLLRQKADEDILAVQARRGTPADLLQKGWHP